MTEPLQPLPADKAAGMPPVMRLRFWLITKLARRDLIMVNTQTIYAPGWEVRKAGKGALVVGNAFTSGPHPEINGELVMAATDKPTALLGLAQTSDLLREVAARLDAVPLKLASDVVNDCRTALRYLPVHALEYRTVGG